MSLISQLFRRLGQEIPKVRASLGNLERYCGYSDESIPQQVHVFELMVPNWWSYFRRLWGL